MADFSLSRALEMGATAYTVVSTNPRCAWAAEGLVGVAAVWVCRQDAWGVANPWFAPHTALCGDPLPHCRWLAPEVLSGHPGQLPADVWAFGTVRAARGSGTGALRCGTPAPVLCAPLPFGCGVLPARLHPL